MEIDQALSTIQRHLFDANLHAFLSGGGLRVIRVEKDGKLIGYGEHPSVIDALIHTAEDLEAGGRPYNEAYGPEGCYTSYLTGSSTPDSPLDAWVRKGSTFDAFIDVDEAVVVLKGHHQMHLPKEIQERVIKTGKKEYYEERGWKFSVKPFTFPGNGEKGVSIVTLRKPEDRPNAKSHRATFYPVTKTGRGRTLGEAIDQALEAEEVEVFDDD